MKAKLKYLGASIGALAAAFVVMSFVQQVSLALFPPPADTDFSNPEAVRNLVSNLPIGALVLVEISYIMASFAAGFFLGGFPWSSREVDPDAKALGWTAREAYPTAAFVGLVLTAFDVVNLVAVPHPLWLAILTLVTFVPTVLLGTWVSLGGRESD